MKTFLRFVMMSAVISLRSICMADSWIDPSWREMLDSSDAVTLVRYTSGGTERATAVVREVYKGSLHQGEHIWLSGYSNRYGPHDRMKVGDYYLVFINKLEPTDEVLQYWVEQATKNPALKIYVAAIKQGQAYRVWTPTSGDLKVKAGLVQYDLIQTTHYRLQHWHALVAFKNFLRSYYSVSGREAECNNLTATIHNVSAADIRVQQLLQLYYLGYNTYQPSFEKYANSINASIRFATARLMGNIRSDQSRAVLAKLLSDKHSLVQGEAARQIAAEPVAFSGPLLLSRLTSAAPGDHGPSGIMDPVMNTMNGGRTQIIYTLGQLGYKPAIPVLLPMLRTQDTELFELLVSTLRKLESREYVPYIIDHLDSLHSRMVLNLCFIIKADSLIECIPAMMRYVKHHDRTEWPTSQYIISATWGLAHFPTDTVRRFLVEDLGRLMAMPDTRDQGIDTKKRWVEEYLLASQSLKLQEVKKPLYDFFYAYYGLDADFREDTGLFAWKAHVEDSLITLAKAAFDPADSASFTALAFVKGDNNNYYVSDYVLKYKVKGIVKSGERDTIFTRLNTRLAAKGIAQEHLLSSYGPYLRTGKVHELLRFGDYFMDYFLSYLAAVADHKDVAFMENLLRYHYPQTEYETTTLQKYIIRARENL